MHVMPSVRAAKRFPHTRIQDIASRTTKFTGPSRNPSDGKNADRFAAFILFKAAEKGI